MMTKGKGWPDYTNIVTLLLAEADIIGKTPPGHAYTEALLRRAAAYIKELREEIEDLHYEIIERT